MRPRKYIRKDGSVRYWQNGVLSNPDGPAVILPTGRKEWRVNGEISRLDGPAVIYPSGHQEWWRAGYPYKIVKNERGIRIGCQEKPTIADWDEWFAGTDEYNHRRDSSEFAALIQLWNQFKEQINEAS
jgi:hypothetical protein